MEYIIASILIAGLGAGACMGYFFKHGLAMMFEEGGVTKLNVRLAEYESLLKSLKKRGASDSELTVIKGYIDDLQREKCL